MAAPLLVYVRIQKIYLPQAPRARLTIHQALRPDDSGIYAPLARLKEAAMYGCATVLMLRTAPSRESQLCFVVSESRPSVGDVEYARLILPLAWFRVGHVVSYSYPMVTRAAHEQPPMALVDVHLSRGDARPFACAPAPLRVAPAWAVPPCMQPPAAAQGAGEQPPAAPARRALPSVIPPEVDSWLQANADGGTE
jgi:hypothetical protein